MLLSMHSDTTSTIIAAAVVWRLYMRCVVANTTAVAAIRTAATGGRRPGIEWSIGTAHFGRNVVDCVATERIVPLTGVEMHEHTHATRHVVSFSRTQTKQ